MKAVSKLVRRLPVALAVVLGFAGSALADGVSKKPAKVVEECCASWSGFYAGFHAGYGWSDATWTHIDDVPPGSVAFDDLSPGDRVTHDLKGWLAGAHIGFNHQFGRWVVGTEFAYSAAGIKGTSLSLEGAQDDVNATKVDSIFIAAARLGLAWDRWLLYAKGGYASGRVETSIVDNTGGAGTGYSSERHNGYILGAGVEVLLTPNWVFGVEYDHLKLRDKVHTFVGFDAGVPTGGLANDVHVDAIHAVVARLSYKFGRGHDAPLK